MQKISKIIATLFFLGYSPLAPGTLASIAAVGVYLLVKGNTPLYTFLTLAFLILGFWSSGKASREFPQKDPPQIVIDEFSSLFIVYIFVHFSWKLLIIGFVLFRLFDILKIPAIKKLESLPSGYGIMLDDIAAAILANLVLQVLRFSPISF